MRFDYILYYIVAFLDVARAGEFGINFIAFFYFQLFFFSITLLASCHLGCYSFVFLLGCCCGYIPLNQMQIQP